MPDHDAIMEAKLKMIDEPHRFVPKRAALLIIDMQHGFVDEGASLEVAAARDLIPNMQSLIAAFRAAEAPVVCTEFVYADNVPCLRGDPFGIEHPEAQGAPGFG
ncbi:MAG: cysteine hydrolase, partial [Pedosphaera sp.]|nr:cysteine hydrolase [Pedosphaera sp.]